MRKTVLAKCLLGLGVGALTLACANVGYASAFQLYEQDNGGLGDYHAGYAINADDSASATFYNPAALTTLKTQQVTAGATYIGTSMDFHGSVFDITQGAMVEGSGNGGVNKVTGNAYYAIPLMNNRLTLGFGVATPFGLATDYPSSSVVSNYTTETSLRVIDLTPAFGFKLNPYVAFGLGLDFENLSGEFDNMVFDQYTDKNSGSAWGMGWHTGIFVTPDAQTRLGFVYHSQVQEDLVGKGTVSGADIIPLKSNNMKADVTLPGWLALSGSRQFGSQWTVMGTAMFTKWDVFQNLKLNNLPTDGFILPTSVTVPQNFGNTWNFALGAHYQFAPSWMLKFGGGYDMTPTNDTDRNLRLPDDNRYALAIGGQYNWHQKVKVDVGYMHLFIENTPINNNPTNPSLAASQGKVDSSANLVGLQVSYNFT